MHKHPRSIDNKYRTSERLLNLRYLVSFIIRN